MNIYFVRDNNINYIMKKKCKNIIFNRKKKKKFKKETKTKKNVSVE